MGHVGEMREKLELRLPQNGKLVFAFVFFSGCTCCCKMDLGLPGKGESPSWEGPSVDALDQHFSRPWNKPSPL